MRDKVILVAQLPGKRLRQDIATVNVHSHTFEWQVDRDCTIIGIRTSTGYTPLHEPKPVLKGDTFAYGTASLRSDR